MQDPCAAASGETIDSITGRRSEIPAARRRVRSISRREYCVLFAGSVTGSLSRCARSKRSNAIHTTASSVGVADRSSSSAAISATLVCPSQCRHTSAAVRFRQRALWRSRSYTSVSSCSSSTTSSSCLARGISAFVVSIGTSLQVGAWSLLQRFNIHAPCRRHNSSETTLSRASAHPFRRPSDGDVWARNVMRARTGKVRVGGQNAQERKRFPLSHHCHPRGTPEDDLGKDVPFTGFRLLFASRHIPCTEDSPLD